MTLFWKVSHRNTNIDHTFFGIYQSPRHLVNHLNQFEILRPGEKPSFHWRAEEVTGIPKNHTNSKEQKKTRKEVTTILPQHLALQPTIEKPSIWPYLTMDLWPKIYTTALSHPRGSSCRLLSLGAPPGLFSNNQLQHRKPQIQELRHIFNKQNIHF